MELCKKCVYAHCDCSPEAMHQMETTGKCSGFRPTRVNCSRCGQDVVHGARETLICLDCLILELAKKGMIDLFRKDKVRRNVETPHKQKNETRTKERILD